MFTTLIAADQLLPLVTAGSVAVFDCRFDLTDPAAGRAAFARGHIPGAAYLDLDRDLSAPSDGRTGRHPLPDRAALAATLAAAGLSQGRQAIAYDDQGGAYAARLWWLLRWLGHDAVAVLDGGLPAWTAAGRPLTTDVSHPGPGDFAPTPTPAGWTADAAEIVATLGSDALLVIDSRAPDRFHGAPNPLDPVPGHIPGARNRFFRDNLDEAGRFKPAATLAAEYDAVLAGTPPSSVVLQCGSGVTACHDLLAMEIAGRSGASLYPGSWSEWIIDPARPVARD